MKTPPENSISDRLQGFNTQAGQSRHLPELVNQTLIVNISDIAEYERNPRVYPNPEHESIRESIRNRGLLQRLVITQRPGRDKYVLLQGGTTRLRCLRELYKETGDLKFAQVLCEFRPWTNEDDLLIGHFVENEQRGNLNWYERSALVCNLHSMFEGHTEESLSDRGFEQQTAAAGLRIRRRGLHLNRYTVDRLGDRLGKQYQHGLGERTIEKIRKLDLASSSIWEDAGLEREKFDKAFFALLRDYDDTGVLNHLLDKTIDLLGDRVPNLHYYKMQAMMRSHIFDNTSAPKYLEVYQAPLKHSVPGTGSTDMKPPPIMRDNRSDPSDPFPESSSGEPVRISPPLGEINPPRSPGRLANLRAKQKRATLLRDKTFKAAKRFAALTGNPDCLRKLRFGPGFMVFDLPPAAESLPYENRRHRDQAWWLLLELSRWQKALQNEPGRLNGALSAEKSVLRDCYDKEYPASLKSLRVRARGHGMTVPEADAIISTLLTEMSDPALRSFNALIVAYREITRLGRDFDIWRHEKKYE